MHTHFIYLKKIIFINKTQTINAHCIVKITNEVDVYPPQTIAPCIVKIINKVDVHLLISDTLTADVFTKISINKKAMVTVLV